jgi:hypothetical protein
MEATIQLHEDTLRRIFADMLDASGDPEAAVLADRFRQGEQISFLAAADALGMDPADLFHEFQIAVYQETGQIIRPVAYAQ